MQKRNKLLVVQVAALGYDFLERHAGLTYGALTFRPMQTVFPAMTCSVQASFRTASLPGKHGVTSNGFFFRPLMRPMFWEQSAQLVEGPRLWDDFRKKGKTVAMLFWQQSLGESADLILSPAPIHKHHGGMIQDCYGRPDGLYAHLSRRLGRPFNLMHYWGPFASWKSSRWIAEATAEVMNEPDLAPDLCLTYLPVLDYDLQRFGPDHPKSRKALKALLDQLALLSTAAERNGYDILVFGDYAIAPCVHGPVFPNRFLRDKGWLSARTIKGMSYPDFYRSRAFAVVDHEIAQIHVRRPEDREEARILLAQLPGVEKIMDHEAMSAAGMDHTNAGDFLLLAAEGYWMAYPWWIDPHEAPEYAGHVDIHNKPGYDPCELFLGWPPGSVSRNPDRIRGSHGRAGEGRKTAWAASWMSNEIHSCIDLAEAVRYWMNS